jgi:6,7-dimethyl-8-ribityllumazine synthase
LGAVIRGETPHFEYISAEVARGIGQVALEWKIPVIFGVLTTDTVDQANERSVLGGRNKGFEAGVAAVEMARLWPTLS